MLGLGQKGRARRASRKNDRREFKLAKRQQRFDARQGRVDARQGRKLAQTEARVDGRTDRKLGDATGQDLLNSTNDVLAAIATGEAGAQVAVRPDTTDPTNQALLIGGAVAAAAALAFLVTR